MDIRNFFKKKPKKDDGKKSGSTKRVAPDESKKSTATKSSKAKGGAKDNSTKEHLQPISADDFFSSHQKKTPSKSDTKHPPIDAVAEEESPRKKQRTSPRKAPPPATKDIEVIDDDSDAEFVLEEKAPKKPAPTPKKVAPAPKKSPPAAKKPSPQPTKKRATPPKQPAKDKPTILEPTRVTPDKPDIDNLRSLCLDSITFCFSGVLPNLSREEATEMVKILGGRVTGNVSSKTHYLVLGEVLEDGRPVEQGKKYQRAQQEKTKLVLDEAHFYGLLQLYGEKSGEESVAKAAAKPAAKVVANPYAPVVNPYASKPKATVNPYASKTTSNPYAKKTSPSPSPQKSLKSTMSSDLNVLWVDKYKPTNSHEILGNAESVRKLTAWLASWERLWNQSKGPKRSQNGPFKAALLSGPPGIGKTTTATLVALESNRDMLEFNASDVRSKKALKEQVGDITGSQTIQFGVKSGQKRQKRCIIMDEVDGMGAGDRSGMSELIQMIKGSRVPIICICNDRQSQKLKSLIPYCLDLRYRRPTKTVIATRAIQIAEQEGLTVERNAVEAIADSCGNDMRQVLNCLQMWAAKNVSLSYKNVKDREHSTQKDEILRVSLFDATRTIVEGRKGLAGADSNTERSHFFRRNDAYFVDYNFLGLMVHQNYLKIVQQKFNEAKRSGNDDNVMGVVDDTFSAASCMSDWAMAEAGLREGQNWSLLPFTASLAVQTGSFAGGPNGCGFPGFPEFSTWLGRNSSRGKKSRLLGELDYHLNSAISGGRTELRLSYLPVFRGRFIEMLTNGEMEPAIKMMDEYGFSRDDVLEKLDEFRLDKSVASFDKLDSKSKAALTRTYNQGSHTSQALVAEEQAGKPKRKAASGAAELKDPDAIDDDAVENEEEPVDEELDAEAIKALFKKKGRKKAAPKTKKAPAKKKTKKK